MTVKELKEILKGVPSNAEVFIQDVDGDWCEPTDISYEKEDNAFVLYNC